MAKAEIDLVMIFPQEYKKIERFITPCKCKIHPFSGKITRWCYTCGKMICNNCGDGYQCPECRYDIKETNKETYGGWCEEFNT